MIGKIVLYVGAGGFLVSFAAFIGLNVEFESYPRAPVPVLGRVVAFNVHGTDHYITHQLQTVFNWASDISWVCFFVICLGAYLTMDKYGRR